MTESALLAKIINLSKDIFDNVGPGYNEVIYHKAFEIALRINNIQYQSEVIIPIIYNGFNIGHGRIDLLVLDTLNNRNIIIELKAISNFNNDTANIQIKNYMKHHSINEGLIINFGQPSRNSVGELNIKYIVKDSINYRIFNFVNNTFIEQTNIVSNNNPNNNTNSISPNNNNTNTNTNTIEMNIY